MPLEVVILGPPGAGKGTQGKRIGAEFGVPHINTGDMLRAERDAGTPFGLRVKAIMDRGELVPDEWMIDLVRGRLAAKDAGRGFVLDGFPRTLAQAEALDAMLASLDRPLEIVLHFQLPEEVAEQRLLKRALEQRRTDDTPEVIHRRMETMRVPDSLVTYYRAKGILVGIHADRTIDEVFAEIQSVLDSRGPAA
jgi:adenylate kinase